ncbi:MAG: phosphonate metabolism protein/1,5-bisphosphokinase (PRPP-forming) PhnN [Gammaproteobacteria bacterium]|nr:phosphonate metabolism protein/1,5-bisphosphokinase (PRPP-forming) PhnN [Gammaproteobacteria bacterium]
MYSHLVIVIGPSGSGKDTLIAGARKVLANDPAFYFTSREITRPSSNSGEQHIAVSEEEFLRRRDAGNYAISWHAHETWYGINRTLEGHLAEGKMVVFNGSRAAINEAKKRFPGVKIIFINVPEDVLADRLSARGRESDLQVRERMSRNRQLTEIPAGSIVMSNAGPLQQTLDKFVSILQALLTDKHELEKKYMDKAG